jgi:hypothetical protein
MQAFAKMACLFPVRQRASTGRPYRQSWRAALRLAQSGAMS